MAEPLCMGPAVRDRCVFGRYILGHCELGPYVLSRRVCVALNSQRRRPKLGSFCNYDRFYLIAFLLPLS